MRARTKQDQVFRFIEKHPGCTTNDIGHALGVTANNAAAACAHLMESRRVKRSIVRTLASNRPVYAYWPESVQTMIPSETGVARNVFSRVKENDSPVSLDRMLDDLALTFATRLVEKIKSNIGNELQSLMPAQELIAVDDSEKQGPEIIDFVIPDGPVTSMPVKKGSPEKRKVGIVGLYPHQEREIEREFGGSFKLSFWTNCNDWKRLEAMAMYCEVVFVMIRHVSHAATLHLKNDKANTVPIHGDTAALRVALTECYLAEASA